MHLWAPILRALLLVLCLLHLSKVTSLTAHPLQMRRMHQQTCLILAIHQIQPCLLQRRLRLFQEGSLQARPRQKPMPVPRLQMRVQAARWPGLPMEQVAALNPWPASPSHTHSRTSHACCAWGPAQPLPVQSLAAMAKQGVSFGASLLREDLIDAQSLKVSEGMGVPSALRPQAALLLRILALIRPRQGEVWYAVR